MLLLITAVAAVMVALYVKANRERMARSRPMHFVQALHKGDLAEVERLLQIDPSLANGTQHGGMTFTSTPLEMAVAQNMVPVVRHLLRNGADPNTLDREGRICLHIAVENDSTGQLTELLLEAGADPNNVGNPKDSLLDRKSPLHRAAEHGHDSAVLHLLNAGAHVNLLDSRGRTALHYAVAGNHAKIVGLLIERGADLTAKDNDGLVPRDMPRLQIQP
jgi:ankyrin repeat protein